MAETDPSSVNMASIDHIPTRPSQGSKHPSSPAKLQWWRISAHMLAAALLSATIALIPFPAPSHAASSLAEEQRALLNARAQAEDARRSSEALDRSAAGAAQDADRARDRAAAVAARIQQSEAELRAGQARIAIIAALQRTQARRLAERQQPIVRLTAGLQDLARRPPVLALLQPGSITDAVHMRMVLAGAMPVIARQTAGLR
ncbi:MAG: hypothetical protein ABW192_04360, partial [Sphingobium sp.]